MNLRRAAATAILLSAACALPAQADDLATSLTTCAAIKNDVARLTCYDDLAAKAGQPTMAQTQAAPPATAPSQSAAQTPSKKDESWFGFVGDMLGGSSTPPSKQTTPQQFGSESLPPPPVKPGETPPPEPIDRITATVSDVAFNPFGRFTVFLDNGQIWQQLQGDTDQAKFPKGKTNQVTISRGMLGSYNLLVNDTPHYYKVKRIK